jgi:Spy/CpxP family protein refolding chaperone
MRKLTAEQKVESRERNRVYIKEYQATHKQPKKVLTAEQKAKLREEYQANTLYIRQRLQSEERLTPEQLKEIAFVKNCCPPKSDSFVQDMLLMRAKAAP